jgi:hypothetical protein
MIKWGCRADPTIASVGHFFMQAMQPVQRPAEIIKARRFLQTFALHFFS